MAGSVPTSGLIAAWDLTNQTAGVQSIAGAHGTAFPLQMGTTAGVDGADPNNVLDSGLDMQTSSRFSIATTLTDASLLADLTIVFVGKSYNNTSGQMGIVSKLAGFSAINTNVPLLFKVNTSARLELRRANAVARSWLGPVVDLQNYQFYAVTAAVPMQTAPNFWIGKEKTAGAAGSGAGTGSPTANAGLFRVGTVDGDAAAAGHYSYVLIYNRILADSEITGIYDYIYPIIVTAGETLTGFGNHMMTSNILPAPQVTSSTTGNAWHAFAGTQNALRWVTTATGTQWVQVDLGAGKLRTLASYIIQHGPVGVVTEAIRDWTVEGSNDALAWDVLDTVTGQSGWTAAEMRVFSVDTISGPYRYFRLVVTANNGHLTAYDVAEWWLFAVYVSDYTPGGLRLLGVGA